MGLFARADQKRGQPGNPGQFAKDTRGKDNIPAPGVQALVHSAPPDSQVNGAAHTLSSTYESFTQTRPRKKDSPENLSAIRDAVNASGLSRAIIKRLLVEETHNAEREIAERNGTSLSPQSRLAHREEAQALARERLMGAAERYNGEKRAKAEQERKWNEGWSRQDTFTQENENALNVLEIRCADMKPGDLFGSRGPLGGGVVTAVRQGRTSSKRQIAYLRPDGVEKTADWNASTRLRICRPNEDSVRQAALNLHKQ